MTVYRVNKSKGNFTQIRNEFINDENRISWKAKMILVYMLSKPDNWSYYGSEITTHAKDGIKSTRSGIDELIVTGYLTRSNKRTVDSKGEYSGYYYDIYEDCYDNKNMYPHGKYVEEDKDDFYDFISSIEGDTF